MLTARELELVRAIADGKTVTAAAADLYVARSTAKWHLANAREKLGARTNAHAVFLAAELGLLRRTPREGDLRPYAAVLQILRVLYVDVESYGGDFGTLVSLAIDRERNGVTA